MLLHPMPFFAHKFKIHVIHNLMFCSADKYAAAIYADLGTTRISHAKFEYYSSAIELRCCESGPTVEVFQIVTRNYVFLLFNS